MLAILIIIERECKNANEVLETEFYAWSISALKFHVAVFLLFSLERFLNISAAIMRKIYSFKASF